VWCITRPRRAEVGWVTWLIRPLPPRLAISAIDKTPLKRARDREGGERERERER